MNIFLLGATGSIGEQVLDVVRNSNHKIIAFSFGKNLKKAIEIIDEFKPEFVSCLQEEDMLFLKEKYSNIIFGYKEEGLIECATYSDKPGLLINSVVGISGLIPTIAAIKKNRDILLANKETLVVAGDYINSLVDEYNVKLYPIDSEHSAIWQCLNGSKKEQVKRLIITASGGSFRDKSLEELIDVTLDDALKHPNWQMGKKITIDSATMVNKGLEVIEAHHLFRIDYDKIETIIHPESIIHSMVEYNDNSIIAQLSNPDMRLPIAYAINYPDRINNGYTKSLDFNEINKLTFRKMDYNRFSLLKLAYEVGKTGGVMPAVYNASNEVAVMLFINGKIKFTKIEEIIKESVLSVNNITNPTIDDIINTDIYVRNQIMNKYDLKERN